MTDEIKIEEVTSADLLKLYGESKNPERDLSDALMYVSEFADYLSKKPHDLTTAEHVNAYALDCHKAYGTWDFILYNNWAVTIFECFMRLRVALGGKASVSKLRIAESTRKLFNLYEESKGAEQDLFDALGGVYCFNEALYVMRFKYADSGFKISVERLELLIKSGFKVLEIAKTKDAAHIAREIGAYIANCSVVFKVEIDYLGGWASTIDTCYQDLYSDLAGCLDDETSKRYMSSYIRTVGWASSLTNIQIEQCFGDPLNARAIRKAHNAAYFEMIRQLHDVWVELPDHMRILISFATASSFEEIRCEDLITIIYGFYEHHRRF